MSQSRSGQGSTVHGRLYLNSINKKQLENAIRDIESSTGANSSAYDPLPSGQDASLGSERRPTIQKVIDPLTGQHTLSLVQLFKGSENKMMSSKNSSSF